MSADKMNARTRVAEFFDFLIHLSAFALFTASWNIIDFKHVII